MLKVIYTKIFNIIKSKFICLGKKNIKFGKNTMITPNSDLSFSKESKVFIGDRIFTDGYCRFIASNNAELSLGYNCYFNMNCFVGANKRIIIGEHCIFGPGVVITDNDHEFKKNKGISSGGYKTGEIIIGNQCWFGANVTILKNTYIGDGCVIGAGCVLRGDIPANSIITNNQDLHMHQIEDR